MVRLWDKIGYTAYDREEYRIQIPDYTAEKLSYWTYADMKREFARSMEIFDENGFSDERVSLAYACVCLKLCFTSDHDTVEELCQSIEAFKNKEKSVAAMTENVMANTIRVIEAFKTGSERTEFPSRREYEEQICAYRSAETRGLTLSSEEQAELDRDIEAALKMIQTFEYSERESDETGIELTDCKPFNMNFENVLKSTPPADSDKRLREKLSDRAYKMLTEYEREDKIVDMGFLENEYLKPNDLKLTDGLREFAELYAGREYIWHAPCFRMDYPLSRSSYKGYSIDLYISGWTGTIRGEDYYIPAMSEFVPPYTGPKIGSDGNIHFYGNEYWENFPELAPISPEEFFEREARERFKDELLIKRRRELENKYLIPEIRTASM